MKIIIVGGGKIGYFLAKTLISQKNKIIVVEEKMSACAKLSNDLNTTVINGDGTDIIYLSEAEAETADILIAVTGSDQNNLIACQLAKKYYNIKKTISRVNNPKNVAVFQSLGVDMVACSTMIIANAIQREVENAGMHTLFKLQKGDVSINEIQITAKMPACNRSLKDIKMTNANIITVIHDGDAIVPNGDTQLLEGDSVIFFSKNSKMEDFKYFVDKAGDKK